MVGMQSATLHNIASGSSLAVPQVLCLACSHRELSVALVQSQGYVYRFCALLLARASGRQVLPGADTIFLD
jgi:predicted metal-binding protein